VSGKQGIGRSREGLLSVGESLNLSGCFWPNALHHK